MKQKEDKIEKIFWGILLSIFPLGLIIGAITLPKHPGIFFAFGFLWVLVEMVALMFYD